MPRPGLRLGYSVGEDTQEDHRGIVNCGRLAARAVNIQPWEFAVVTEPDALRRIAKTSDYEGSLLIPQYASLLYAGTRSITSKTEARHADPGLDSGGRRPRMQVGFRIEPNSGERKGELLL